MKKSYILFIIGLFVLPFTVIILLKSSGNQPVDYEIVDTEVSGGLAWSHRMRYRIAVSPKIKENQVRPTVKKIISDITTEDRYIDEIILWLYSDKELVKGGIGYDLGSAIWAPDGKLGKVTPYIAKNNIRTGYKISIKTKKNLEAYLKQRGLSEEKFGFTEKQRRQILMEIVAAEDKAEAEAEKIYPLNPSDPNYPYDNYKEQAIKHDEKSSELMKKYRA